METKDELLSEGEKYFEKVMQDFNQNRQGRNLRKYCNDEGIDYKWLSEYKRTYGATKSATSPKPDAPNYGFTALDEIEERLSPEQQQPIKDTGWTVRQIIICSPEGEEEIAPKEAFKKELETQLASKKAEIARLEKRRRK